MPAEAPFRVAIVGRPNVGKSSLLNRLVRRTVSIVEPTAGVTRDRVEVRIDIGGRTIYDEPRIPADMGVIDTDAGPRNSLGDPATSSMGGSRSSCAVNLRWSFPRGPSGSRPRTPTATISTSRCWVYRRRTTGCTPPYSN